MIGYFKRRRALKLGREFAATIINRVEEHIAGRVQPARERFVAVLRDRLKDVLNEPEHDPRLLTRIELEVFEENLQEFLGEMRAELSISLYRYDEAIQAADLQETSDLYIDKRIGDIRAEMLAEAAELAIEALSDIAEHNTEQEPGT